MKNNYSITKSNGEVLLNAIPGHALNISRKAIADKLQECVTDKRICGYDAQWIKNGRIALYFNTLIDEDGEAARYVANEIVEIIESND